MKDQNEILEENALYGVEGDFEIKVFKIQTVFDTVSCMILNDLDDASNIEKILQKFSESIKISRPTKSQQPRTWVSTKEINGK